MKKLIAIISASALAMSLAVTSLGAELPSALTTTPPYCGYGYYGGYGFMCDQYGNLLEKDVFEANLDVMVEEGRIRSENRDFYLDMYDRCSTYGGGAFRGGYGGCRGGGRGMGWGARY